MYNQTIQILAFTLFYFIKMNSLNKLLRSFYRISEITNRSILSRGLCSKSIDKNTYNPKRPVWSCNEWDLLQECIVGIPDNAVVPSLTPEAKACFGSKLRVFLEANGGKYWSDVLPEGFWKNIQNEITEFCRVLEGEGVKVVRPEPQDFGKVFTTPFFSSHGLYAAMPRDIILVVGDELIESTMTWQSRYFEFVSYRKLMKNYYDKGAKWTVAPKPLMVPELIEKNYDFDGNNWLKRVTTEAEICFDAADFFRCGKDIFAQRSQVTNSSSINWLRRHLEPQGIKVHELNFRDPYCMHVDATLVPVKPGVFLKNPNYALVEEDMFNKCGWDMVDVPEPLLSEDKLYMSSNYLAMNTLMMDSKRVFCEKDEFGTHKLFKSLGVEPIPVNMKHCFAIGGGFHCWTCDVRRKGNMESYFSWSKEVLDKYKEQYLTNA